MRKFSSYGLVDKDIHYYVPREELIQMACTQLIGDDPRKGGHFITVWAPRQCGKTWIMREVLYRIRSDKRFYIAMLNFQSAKTIETDKEMLSYFVELLNGFFTKKLPSINSWKQMNKLFQNSFFDKPVILIIDEFDALKEDFINRFANEFRKMYITRQTENNQNTYEKECMLHGLALIGVRSVLGIENVTGSPFNVQRSMHIPNLTFEEVQSMFRWYEKETGHKVDQDVINQIYYETQGQPGLVSWFGELLTEGYGEYKPDTTEPIMINNFKEVYSDAVEILPNNTVLNIISKAKQEPYNELILELFKTQETLSFRFDDPLINFLYMNGIIDYEKSTKKENVVKFSSPFVQKRLFNYFSRQIFRTMDYLYNPMDDLSTIIDENKINIPNLMRLYEKYLKENRTWLLKDAPRRKTDMRIYEAVYHFNLYMYLKHFFQDMDGNVVPEFPTGNGKVDILITYKENLYALELKSFRNYLIYKKSLTRAAEYAAELGQNIVYLILFIEEVNDENRKKFEVVYEDDGTGVKVIPIFVETSNRSPYL
jgi:hypothetical protein